jgi:hypothetical protein
METLSIGSITKTGTPREGSLQLSDSGERYFFEESETEGSLTEPDDDVHEDAEFGCSFSESDEEEDDDDSDDDDIDNGIGVGDGDDTNNGAIDDDAWINVDDEENACKNEDDDEDDDDACNNDDDEGDGDDDDANGKGSNECP